jgi:hypothetical protein
MAPETLPFQAGDAGLTFAASLLVGGLALAGSARSP